MTNIEERTHGSSKEKTALRPACTEDLPAVLRLFGSAVEKMRKSGIDQWDERYPDDETLSEDIRKEEMYLLEEDGGIAAAVVLNVDQDPGYGSVPWSIRAEPVAVIHRLCVSAESQGKGLGVKTLRLSEQFLAERGFRCIRLDAFPQNPAAMHLYPSNGYRLAGQVTFRKGTFNCYEKLLPASELKPGARFTLLAGEFAVCKITDPRKIDFRAGPFVSLTATDEEFSLVCARDNVPGGCAAVENGWRCLKLLGPLDFSLTGVLAGVSAALAEEGISIFAVSTFDTDYIMIKQERVAGAVKALTERGYLYIKQN